ncbi:MAG: 2-C-methyl-D-erythritol 4-phosphate cytidylyltransferase [Pyrinomonadaceae bacterium]
MNVAIIAAAGQGQRFGGERAKQFVELCGVPVIVHTLRRFESCPDIHQVIVVVPAAESAGFLELTARYGLRKVDRVVPGGVTRFESVNRGFQAIRPATAEVVAIHDGARPFVRPEEISLTVQAAAEHGAAILAAPVTDTIKLLGDGGLISTLDRSKLRRALTPQCFRYDWLRRGLAAAVNADSEITDDSTLIEALGEPVQIVEGGARNIKITNPEDIAWGELLLKQVELSDQD